MMRHAYTQGVRRIGLLLASTAWGRSGLRSAERHLAAFSGLTLTYPAWFNWGDRSLMAQYKTLRDDGAEAIIFVTNDIEGSLLVRELAGLPPEQRRPLICHWGITGGNFVGLAGEALSLVDLTVVQTFSFFRADPAVAAPVLEDTRRLFGVSGAESIESAVGFAHAYDLVHILARAITLAGTSDRTAVRAALEQVRDYRGLVRHFPRPFEPGRHEALDSEDVIIARYRPDGVIVPVAATP
ncbi:hypothetical protein CCP1ISM_1840001 [Azospirillaceae bacterium]